MSLTVLAVDDEPDILFLIEVNLRSSGYELLRTTSAEEALELCRQHAPDVLLLDVAMPGTDGPTLLGQLRARGLAPRRVVLVSATPREELEELARKFEVSYLSKPFSPTDLLGAVADAAEVKPAMP